MSKTYKELKDELHLSMDRVANLRDILENRDAECRRLSRELSDMQVRLIQANRNIATKSEYADRLWRENDRLKRERERVLKMSAMKLLIYIWREKRCKKN